MIRRTLVAIGVITLSACHVNVTMGVNPALAGDILITNARVVDGTGNPWYRGAVLVSGDRIKYVGPALADLRAKRVIDARGQVVSPGFIDMLGHSESVLPTRPHARRAKLGVPKRHRPDHL